MKSITTISDTKFKTISIIICVFIIIVFSALRHNIERETETKLRDTLKTIKLVMGKGFKVNYEPYALALPLTEPQGLRTESISDTVITNPGTKDNTTYTELKSIYSDKSGIYLVIVRIESPANTVFWLSLGLKFSIFTLLVVISLMIFRRPRKDSTIISNDNPLLTLKNEFKDLGTSFEDAPLGQIKSISAMLMQITEHLKSLKESDSDTIDSISQDLQPILSALITKAEISQKNKTIPSEQLEEIDKLHECSLQLMDINISLALISKINSPEFSEKSDINIKEFLTEQLRDYTAMGSERSISFNIVCMEEVTLAMNRDLLEIMVSHLMVNALNHNMDGGTVSIELRTNFIEVSNSGNPLKKNPIDLFLPFVKDNDTDSSSGLGLSIIKKIAGLYDFSPSYYYSDGKHIIRITFNVKEN